MLALFTRMLGLPAHPLLVHLPVFLVPLSALGLVVIAVSPVWRARLGWWVVAVAFVSLVSVQLAMSSGEALQPHVGDRALVVRHAELADPLRPLAVLLLALSAGVVLLERRRDASWHRAVTVGVVGASVLVAAASTWQLARVGHSGAKAVWHETPTSGPGRSDGDRE